MELFAYKKALADINRSARSVEAPGTTVSGFAERLVRQYGPTAVMWAVDRSQLTALQAGWVKRWIMDQANTVRARR